MKRALALLLGLFLLLAGLPSRVFAAQQTLQVISHRFYPMQDLTFVDIMNPHFAPLDNIIVNMVIREGTGQKRVIAIGQTFLQKELVLRPGEHVSARVPIRARVVRDIPANAGFEFVVTGRQLEQDATPPDVVVLGSANGVNLEFNRDLDGVPMVFAFIGLSQESPDDTQAQVQGAVLTFYNSDRQVVWSEYMPIGGQLAKNESLMIYGKYQHITAPLVPDITQIDVKFIVVGQN